MENWQETDGREYWRRGGERSREDETAPDPLESAARQEKTLQQTLLEQLGCQKLEPLERQLACYIIGTLDGNGWWREDVAATARAFGVEPEAVKKALHRVQQMEPAGVGAENLAQCLELQLAQRPEVPELVHQVVREGLELLGENQIPALAKSSMSPTRQCWLPGKSSAVWIPSPVPGTPAPDRFPYQRRMYGWKPVPKGLLLRYTIPGAASSC